MTVLEQRDYCATSRYRWEIWGDPEAENGGWGMNCSGVGWCAELEVVDLRGVTDEWGNLVSPP